MSGIYNSHLISGKYDFSLVFNKDIYLTMKNLCKSRKKKLFIETENFFFLIQHRAAQNSVPVPSQDYIENH